MQHRARRRRPNRGAERAAAARSAKSGAGGRARRATAGGRAAAAGAPVPCRRQRTRRQRQRRRRRRRRRKRSRRRKRFHRIGISRAGGAGKTTPTNVSPPNVSSLPHHGAARNFLKKVALTHFSFAANGAFIASPNFSMVLFLRGRSSCGGGSVESLHRYDPLLALRFAQIVAPCPAICPPPAAAFWFRPVGSNDAVVRWRLPAAARARLFFFLTLLIDGSLPPRRDGGGGADERGAEKVRWRFFIKMCRRRALCFFHVAAFAS